MRVRGIYATDAGLGVCAPTSRLLAQARRDDTGEVLYEWPGAAPVLGALPPPNVAVAAELAIKRPELRPPTVRPVAAAQTYETQVLWNDVVHTVRLSIDEAAVRLLGNRRCHRLDLAAARWVFDDGRRLPIVATRHRADYAALHGDKAPPWALHLTEVEAFTDLPPRLDHCFVLPLELRVRAEGGRVQTVVEAYTTTLDVFETLVRRPPPSVSVGRTNAPSFMTALRQPGFAVTTASLEARCTTLAIIDGVLGAPLERAPHERQTKLQRLLELRAALVSAQGRGDTHLYAQLLHDSRGLLRAPADTHPNADALINALNEQTLRLEQAMQAEVEVVVVPADASLAAIERRLGERLPEGALTQGMITGKGPADGPTKLWVLLPENDLEQQRFLLTCLLELLFLSAEECATLDRLHAHAVAHQGPFAEPRGADRSLYLATLRQLYEGPQALRGRRWLAARVPEVLAIFQRAQRLTTPQ